MAEKVTVELVDDLDGSVATETVEFTLDGATFHIDLSSRNATKLREHLAMYISASRRSINGHRPAAQHGQASPTTSRSTSTEERRRNRKIREWARREGLTISERGRIPHELIHRFTTAAQDA